MTSNRVDEAAVVPPPRKSVVRATVTTTEAFILPTEWYGGWIKVHNDDGSAKLGIKFGISSAACTAMTALTAVATLTSSLPDQAATSPGEVIPAGQKEHYNLADFETAGIANDSARIWIGHVSSATGGFIRITKSSGPTKV